MTTKGSVLGPDGGRNWEWVGGGKQSCKAGPEKKKKKERKKKEGAIVELRKEASD
jgi:hypothetical protein